MTTALACEPAPILSSPHFRILDVGEPVDVRVGLFLSEADLSGCLEELCRPDVSSLHLVIRGSAPLEKSLRQLRSFPAPRLSADYLTLVWVPHEPGRHVVTASDLWNVCHAPRGNLYLTESDPARAVIGTMQWLRGGDTFALLWPAELGFEVAESLVTQGASWRASLEAPEEGEFHPLPPAAGAHIAWDR